MVSVKSWAYLNFLKPLQKIWKFQKRPREKNDRTQSITITHLYPCCSAADISLGSHYLRHISVEPISAWCRSWTIHSSVHEAPSLKQKRNIDEKVIIEINENLIITTFGKLPRKVSSNVIGQPILPAPRFHTNKFVLTLNQFWHSRHAVIIWHLMPHITCKWLSLRLCFQKTNGNKTHFSWMHKITNIYSLPIYSSSASNCIELTYYYLFCLILVLRNWFQT